MEPLLLIGLAVGIWVLHDRLSERRERETAERLARLHEKLRGTEAAGAASEAVDAAVRAAQAEASAVRRWSGRGPY